MTETETKVSNRKPGRGWAYLGALLGGAVSIAANVAHSYVPPKDAPTGWHPQGGAVIGAVFWPVALFVAIEILARVPWPAGRRWVAVRYLGLLPVAAVAAVVSYRHLSGLLEWYAEDGLTVVIGPLAVDGLMVMATGALIATGRRMNPDTHGHVAAQEMKINSVDHELPGMADTLPPTTPADDLDALVNALEEPATEPDTAPDKKPATGRTPRRTLTTTADRTRQPDTTAAKVAKLRAKQQDITQADVARRLKISTRTVSRHWTDTAPATKHDTEPDTQPINGHAVPNLVTTD